MKSFISCLIRRRLVQLVVRGRAVRLDSPRRSAGGGSGGWRRVGACVRPACWGPNASANDAAGDQGGRRGAHALPVRARHHAAAAAQEDEGAHCFWCFTSRVCQVCLPHTAAAAQADERAQCRGYWVCLAQISACLGPHPPALSAGSIGCRRVVWLQRLDDCCSSRFNMADCAAPQRHAACMQCIVRGPWYHRRG